MEKWRGKKENLQEIYESERRLKLMTESEWSLNLIIAVQNYSPIVWEGPFKMRVYESFFLFFEFF